MQAQYDSSDLHTCMSLFWYQVCLGECSNLIRVRTKDCSASHVDLVAPAEPPRTPSLRVNQTDCGFESIYSHFWAGSLSECLFLRCVSISSHRPTKLTILEPKQPFALLLLWLSFCTVAFGGPDFPTCLQNVLSSRSLDGTVDTNGNPTTNTDLITGLTYDRCVADCGPGSVDFNWYTFSRNFISWLVPWLALISQLPYGTRDALSNFVAVILTVGSPTLAAYSLALAIISNRWMIKQFERSTYTNTCLAAKVLSNLQQVSLELPREEHVLPSLIVLPKNGIWWKTLDSGLDYSVQKWTLASIISVSFVALVGIFTWIAILAVPRFNIGSDAMGEIIASPWLCFLPILIGNLQLAPKSDWDRIRRAFNQANSSFYLATDDGLPERGRGSLLIRTASWDAIDEDELCSAAIFFYARAFTWIRVARKVADSFDAASRYECDHRKNDAPPRKRQQVIDYCKSDDQTNAHIYEICSIFLKSTFLAIFLQWGTTGAAVMAMFLTPTKGQLDRSFLYPY